MKSSRDNTQKVRSMQFLKHYSRKNHSNKAKKITLEEERLELHSLLNKFHHTSRPLVSISKQIIKLMMFLLKFISQRGIHIFFKLVTLQLLFYKEMQLIMIEPHWLELLYCREDSFNLLPRILLLSISRNSIRLLIQMIRQSF